MTMLSRVTKLEEQHRSTGDIAIWCADAGDVSATIDTMVVEGELQDADRPRCVHWSRMQAPEGCHERALGILI